jgi:hypothetical protein
VTSDHFDILQHGLSVVLDFPTNTVSHRDWMRSLITQANAAHELHLLDVPDAICKQRLDQLYRNRDELKNQWGWGDFTTRDVSSVTA